MIGRKYYLLEEEKMTIPSLKISFSKSDRKEILNGIDKCLEHGQISQLHQLLRQQCEYWV